MRKLVLAVSATAMAIPATFVVPVDSPAQAQSRYYDSNGNYVGPVWRDSRGRYHCRRGNGTTGLLVGGGAGALVGRGIDGGRHRGAGTIIGAIAGAVIGSAVEQSANRQRCG